MPKTKKVQQKSNFKEDNRALPLYVLLRSAIIEEGFKQKRR